MPHSLVNLALTYQGPQISKRPIDVVLDGLMDTKYVLLYFHHVQKTRFMPAWSSSFSAFLQKILYLGRWCFDTPWSGRPLNFLLSDVLTFLSTWYGRSFYWAVKETPQHLRSISLYGRSLCSGPSKPLPATCVTLARISSPFFLVCKLRFICQLNR
jgi:hypothetical protein